MTKLIFVEFIGGPKDGIIEDRDRHLASNHTWELPEQKGHYKLTEAHYYLEWVEDE